MFQIVISKLCTKQNLILQNRIQIKIKIPT
jgi:hypothetical protein